MNYNKFAAENALARADGEEVRLGPIDTQPMLAMNCDPP